VIYPFIDTAIKEPHAENGIQGSDIENGKPKVSKGREQYVHRSRASWKRPGNVKWVNAGEERKRGRLEL
jgi:hypothetical protein